MEELVGKRERRRRGTRSEWYRQRRQRPLLTMRKGGEGDGNE
jgi:hypothetical protein